MIEQTKFLGMPLSLPQAVVLWMGPEGPAGELAEVRVGTRQGLREVG